MRLRPGPPPGSGARNGFPPRAPPRARPAVPGRAGPGGAELSAPRAAAWGLRAENGAAARAAGKLGAGRLNAEPLCGCRSRNRGSAEVRRELWDHPIHPLVRQLARVGVREILSMSREGTLQPPGSLLLSSATDNKDPLCVRMELPTFQSVSVSPCSIAVCRQKEPSPIHLTSAPQMFMSS